MASQSQPSDRTLLMRFQTGHEDAATQLYLRYAHRLRALALKHTAEDLKARIDPEDIVQSIFRTFFHRAARGQYAVPEGEELWRLFLVIALNKIRTVGAYHHAAIRDTRQTSANLEIAEAANDQEDMQTLRLTIEDLMKTLTAEQQQMVSMRIDGHDVATIAKSTGRAKRSVERLLQGFRKSLSDQMGISESDL